MPFRIVGVLMTVHLAGRLLWGQTESGDLKAAVLGQHPFQHQQLTESSGLVASRSQSGILWTLNDSDNPAELFATDTLGRNHGAVLVEGAQNEDWEALGIARCGTGDCLYAADVGDNRERRNSVQIYRIREPRANRDSVARPDAVLNIRYADRPHNVEAILVTPGQDVFLISKTSREGPAVYKVPGSAWGGGEGEATLVQTLPIPSDQGIPYVVTDAALSPDGRRIAVRTYRYVYFFFFDGERLTPVSRGFRCDATGLGRQEEGIAWLGGDTLATTSERVAMMPGTISRIACRD